MRDENINLSKIIQRLELIKSLISLEEEDEIDAHIFKLEQFGITPKLEPIIVSSKKSYCIFLPRTYKMKIYNE